MRREELLEKGYTEEQVTDILNTYHQLNAETKKANDEAAHIKEQAVALQKQLDDIKKANMSEQEKYEQMKKETELNLANSKKIYNKAKVKEILAGYDIEDDIINSFVSEDENSSINGANLFKARLDTIIANTTKKVEEKISNIDVKPNPTNIPQDTGMSKEKLSKMTMTEQLEFKRANPEAYENLMN